MSFATDYRTAYELCRTGRVDRDIYDKILNGNLAGDIKKTLRKRMRTGVMGRVRASIYAFKLVKEMRRQNVLVSQMFLNVDDRTQQRYEHVVAQKRPITLFPITVNRTTVRVNDTEKDA